MLKFYDFEKDAVGIQSSETLFADKDIFSASLEKLLNERAENAFANQIDRIAHTKKPLSNFRAYRTVILAILLQAPQIDGARGNLDSLEQFRSFNQGQEEQVRFVIAAF